MAQVTIAKGYDCDYYLDKVGADYYLTAGEPPGIWAGRAAAELGLSGEAEAEVMKRLYHEHIGPDGQVMGKAQRSPEYETKRTHKEIDERIDERIADLGGPAFETPEAIRHIKLSERAKARKTVPYIDTTFSSEKSISLAWAAARVSMMAAMEDAKQAAGGGAEQIRADGEPPAEQIEADSRPSSPEAARWEQLAEQVEAATMAGADAMFGYLENRGAAMLRTGHHSAHSGEWRDATGFIGVKFLQHTSRKGDPQLHVQIPIANLAQRADRADDKWRTLDGAQLWHLRLGAAAHGSLAEAQALAELGIPLVKRADGCGFEIGGVTQKTMNAFSRRTRDIEKKIAEYVAQYEETYGRPPSRANLYRRRKEITVKTRARKGSPGCSARRGPSSEEAAVAEERLAEWVEQAEAEHAQALKNLWDDIWAWKAEHPEADPSSAPSESEQAEIIRASIAEVQRKNAAWSRAQLEWEIFLQLPRLPAGMDWRGFLDELADRALQNSTEGVTVVQIGSMPDVVNVEGLGHRESDGVSVYRKPNEQRYATTEHINLESWILERSLHLTGQRVTEAEADAALEGTDLDHDQAAAVRGLLTSGQAVTSLVAPAGTGKSYAMARFSRIWMEQTGCRVIGLTLSENASRVLAGEGMTEAHNIAKWFARGARVYAGDVLVVDEASQVSTADLARIMTLAEENDARVILTGDPRQLPAVEAGGLFGLLAKEDGAFRLEEVRRFKESWEKEASVRMRAGDLGAWAEYAARGLVSEGPSDRVKEEAVDAYLADTALGETSLLLAGTNEAAAELAGMVRERRVERGQVPAEAEVVLSDGNDASTGDLLRARLNAKISAGGRTLANRDTLRLEGWIGTGTDREAVVVRELSEAEAADDPVTREIDHLASAARERVARLERAREAPGADVAAVDELLADERRELQALIDRRRAEGGWSRRFTVPEAYLRENAELAYAGNVYTAQGRTVDRGHLVIDEALSRDMLYVGMTRGREFNKAHVITGPPDPKDWTRAERNEWERQAVMDAAELAKTGDIEAAVARMQRPEPEGLMVRAPWESVIAACMERDDPAPTATETIREAQEVPVHTRHLLDLLEAQWEKDVVPQIDAMVRDRIPAADYARYVKDPARPAFLQTVREHELAGRPIADLLDSITQRELTGLRSIAAGLQGRAAKEPQPEKGRTNTWGERIPEVWKTNHPLIAEKAQALDERQRELGERVAEQAPHWALSRWGVPPTEAGPLRDDWIKRAGQVESYRELVGITDPAQAIAPPPVRQAHVTEAFSSAVHALGLPDEAAMAAAMNRGELEADIRNYERAQAAGPRDVSAELDAYRAAAEYAEAQAAEAELAGNPEMEASARALVAEITEGRERLTVADAAHREWAEAVAPQAEAAERARDELRRRKNPAAEAEAQQERQGEPQAERASIIDPVTGHVDPQAAAELRARQTARVEADRQARREKSAAEIAEIDPELARSAYPDIDLDKLKAEREPTAAEQIDRDLETIRNARTKVSGALAELEAAAEEDRYRDMYRDREVEREAAYEPGRRPLPPPRRIERDGPELSL